MVGPGAYWFWKWWNSLTWAEQWRAMGNGMAVPNIDPVPPDFHLELPPSHSRMHPPPMVNRNAIGNGIANAAAHGNPDGVYHAANGCYGGVYQTVPSSLGS